ncbi:hypothetical protein C9E89_021055, partial [Acinetobacter sichuanensis]
MTKPNISKHPCTNKCSEFQCNNCFIMANSPELESAESDFLVGDVVVYIDAFMPNDLMTVHKVQTRNDHYWLNGQCIYKSWIRTATVAELH